MSDQVRLPELSLGELEQAVLDALWAYGAMNPNEAHAQVGAPRGISVNTVASALKRLWGKGLLARRKVSHAYVYEAKITREGLQRELISAIASQFGDGSGQGMLAAFVDLAEAQGGEETLRRLEGLIAARLEQSGAASDGEGA